MTNEEIQVAAKAYSYTIPGYFDHRGRPRSDDDYEEFYTSIGNFRQGDIDSFIAGVKWLADQIKNNSDGK